MKLSRESKVGILAVVTLAMLYFGFNYLKGSDFFSGNRQYVVLYDSIDGLAPSNSVLINGLSVGRVKKIEILQNQGNKLLVTLDIQNKIRLNEGTKAILADGGILGGKVIRLDVSQTGRELENGDTLRGTQESGIAEMVREKTLPVLNNIDSMTHNMNRILLQFDQTGLVLNRTLKAAETATGTVQLTIAENRANIRALLATMNRLSADLVETDRQVRPLLARTTTFVDSLNALQLRQTLNNLNGTINNMKGMLADIERGQGTLGRLANDQALYVNLTNSTASLDRLLTDLRENPKRYVHFSLFGGKDKKKAAPPVPPVSSTTTVTTTTSIRVDSTGKTADQ
ncbi:MlaD family protein [Nibrella saemangeumensis]|uniref:MlaD family protein n=1 Tax=Nibrella saemangeumensis TaxID=1084526 RepID=A0ABP8NBQ0_9BACT